jgi:hypothetical protein
MKKLIDLIRFKNILPHLSAVLIFIGISFCVFYPVIKGKKLFQSDIQQYQGMSKQLQESRKKGVELYWIDNAFGGMPTYQLGAKYPFDFLTPIHKIVRLLPHPIFLVFLYFLSCYLLLLSMRVPMKYALFGALAYGLSTYLLIIIQVGHNTKAQALGYLPIVLAGVQWVFRKKYFLGFVFSCFAIAMQIRANHYQITYYLLLLLLVFGVVQLWNHFKNDQHIDFFKKIGVLFLAGFFALGLNATSLLATSEYSKFSTRGKSELTLSATGVPIEARSGLSYDYITQFSYGIFESLNLIVPRIQGGGSRENLGTSSEVYEYLIRQGAGRKQAKSFSENVPTYWGDQPILEAPAYIGIVIVFLAFLAIFLGWNMQKRWLFFGILLSLFLSWGKNLPFLTHFFIDYIPFYSKFRAVSSIQVLLELAFPVLATIGLVDFFNASKYQQIESLKKTIFLFGGFASVLFLVKGMLSFEGATDNYYRQAIGSELMQQIYKARKAVYTEDLIRAVIFVVITASLLWASSLQKLKSNIVYIIILLLMLIDLGGISNRYLNRDLFTSKSRAKTAFFPSDADRLILKDSSYFRVYEPSMRLAGARTSYFHNAIGGYHGAKPRRYEEVFQMFESLQREEILNILNVKYILFEAEEGGLKSFMNPETLGNAWFVENLFKTSSPDSTYQQLATLNFSSAAVSESDALQNLPNTFLRDSLASIKLIQHEPEHLRYESNSNQDGFAVFSEMYYPFGWKATIDGVEQPHFNVNYILRGMTIPKGKHLIEFTFDPSVVNFGGKIQLISFLVLMGLIILGIRRQLKNKSL